MATKAITLRDIVAGIDGIDRVLPTLSADNKKAAKKIREQLVEKLPEKLRSLL